MAPTGQYKQPRREERFPVRVPVTLRIGRDTVELYTGDVSFRGLFVCTDNPPTLRQLITVEMQIPPGNDLFTSHGMSVYVLEPGQEVGRMPGVGIQFYAQADAQRRQWERFVATVRSKPLDLPDGAVDPVKRLHRRIAARFEVRPKDLDELESIFTRDVSNGGMFLETDMELDPGKSLSVTIYHPVSNRGFTMESIVRRRSSEDPKGVGVEFTGMDENRRHHFENFVEEGLAALNDISIES
jgi:Tfp pilus assembly protein PilZ